MNTGRAEFCIAWGETNPATAPLLKVRGADGVWRGAGRWITPDNLEIIKRKNRGFGSWAVFLVRVGLFYTFSTGQNYALILEFHAGEATVLAHEISPAIEGAAWEFSLREWSGNGRAYLHWTPEHGNAHWSDLSAEDRELARLQESVPWWIAPAGFGVAMTPDELENQDYLALFTLRRGDWIDREFEKLTWGPKDENGAENRELDWPFPEMVGSTISMLTAQTDQSGDAFFSLEIVRRRAALGLFGFGFGAQRRALERDFGGST